MTVGQLLLNKDLLSDIASIEELFSQQQDRAKKASVGSMVGRVLLPFALDLFVPGLGRAAQAYGSVGQLGYTAGTNLLGSKIGEAVAGPAADPKKLEQLSKGLRFGKDKALQGADAIEKAAKDLDQQQLLSAGTAALTSEAGMNILKDMPMFKTAIGDKLKFSKHYINPKKYTNEEIDGMLKSFENREDFDPLDPVYMAIKNLQGSEVD
tara:strand:- start:976 stop:1602 length:627 start_codon:yes stop_codon:yes gene_type:complete